MQNYKEKIVAALLALFLGPLGIHRFYLNEQDAGKKYLIWFIVGIVLCPILIGFIPLVVLSIVAFVDCFKILFMSDHDWNVKYNGYPVCPDLLYTDECYGKEQEHVSV